MYQKVSTNMNFVEREKKTEEFWRENHIFEKSIEQRKQGRRIRFMTARRQPTESPISATS